MEHETARSHVITTPGEPTSVTTAGLPSDQPLLDGLARPLGRAHSLVEVGVVVAPPARLALTGSVHTTEAAHAGSRTLDAATRTWYDSRAEQDDGLDLAVVDAATGACVGEVVLNDWRVELEVYANNPRALAVYRRVGFVVEGRQREVFVVDGQRVDAITMSVLRPERAARRPA